MLSKCLRSLGCAENQFHHFSHLLFFFSSSFFSISIFRLNMWCQMTTSQKKNLFMFCMQCFFFPSLSPYYFKCLFPFWPFGRIRGLVAEVSPVQCVQITFHEFYLLNVFRTMNDHNVCVLIHACTFKCNYSLCINRLGLHYQLPVFFLVLFSSLFAIFFFHH